MNNQLYADVLTGYPLDSAFTYRVPSGMNVTEGMRVRVNFAGRKLPAAVIRTHNKKPQDFDVKDILGVIDEGRIFDSRLVKLCNRIASDYLAAPGEVISLALPSGETESNRYKIPFEKTERPDFGLSDEQQGVFTSIVNCRDNGDLYHLIFGVTGSGKTEVYIELAKKTINEGRSVIFLVPEISLSSQIFKRLYAVFGDDLIVYHSHLTPNQRLYNWNRFYSGDAKIAIGTRSAVFLQSPDTGLIVLDEEHDGSYKEQSTPRYNARRVAFSRAIDEKCIVVMGSATPSLESLYACEKGSIKLHTLEKRYSGSKLPDIEIVQIEPGSQVLSSTLKLYARRTVDAGKQAVFLLNRRGFAPVVMCGDCGTPVECPDCSISMNYHNTGNLVCHYCGNTMDVPSHCTECHSDNIIKVGAGTQRVEEVVMDEFSDFRIFRLDQDTARKKTTVNELIDRMTEGDIDILLGTQMVAKGFDFPDVTLVGVLMADIGLNLPDFRAPERIFSLLLQVAGRCGRGDTPGRVILQTLRADHQVFQFIKQHDYLGFYRSELSARKMLNYPPFSRLARLLVRGQDKQKVIETSAELGRRLREHSVNSDVQVLGPAEAPFGKIAKNYRHHIILKSSSVQSLRNVIRKAKEGISARDVYIEVDIDPVEML